MRRALAAAGVLGVAASCTLLNPLDGYSGGALDAAPEATPDTSSPPPPPVEAAVDALPACEPLLPPTRPPASDPKAQSFLLAGDTLDYGRVGEGYDLDGLCTCPGAAACTLSANPSPACDSPRGVDNVLGPLLTSTLALFPGRGEYTGTDYIKAGSQNILVQLQGYNGTDNDDAVQVGVIASPGILGRTDAGPSPIPKLDGTDTWQVEDDSVVGTSQSFPFETRIEDRAAYVRDGVLVATLDVDLRVGLFRARAKEAKLVGKLVREGSLLRLRDAFLSGRVLAADLLTGLEVLRSPITLQPLCRQEPLYLEAKRRICEAMDLPGTRADDGRGVPCRAISLALRFSAVTAFAGPVVSAAQPRPCGTDWFDDCPQQ
jgi:hypothetical protein